MHECEWVRRRWVTPHCRLFQSAHDKRWSSYPSAAPLVRRGWAAARASKVRCFLSLASSYSCLPWWLLAASLAAHGPIVTLWMSWMTVFCHTWRASTSSSELEYSQHPTSQVALAYFKVTRPMRWKTTTFPWLFLGIRGIPISTVNFIKISNVLATKWVFLYFTRDKPSRLGTVQGNRGYLVTLPYLLF